MLWHSEAICSWVFSALKKESWVIESYLIYAKVHKLKQTPHIPSDVVQGVKQDTLNPAIEVWSGRDDVMG